MSRGPFRAWVSVQSESVWNRTERDLLRGWYSFVKVIFHLLCDDADLYDFLWGRSLSWVWPLIPLSLAGLSTLAVVGIWSYQIAAGLPAAGSWRFLPEVMALLGLALGMGAGFHESPSLPMNQPWPLTRGNAMAIQMASPFLHPSCQLALLVGAVAAAPWAMRHAALFAITLVLLPILVYRAGLGLMALGKALYKPRRIQLASSEGPDATLRRFFRQMAGRGGGVVGRAGFLLALPLLFHGAFILGFSLLGFCWAIVQADILRLEGRSVSLMASLPISAEVQVDARIRGVAIWSSPSAIAALAAMSLGYGPLALLPGAVALVQMHLTGAALGLLASASSPLDGSSLKTLQSLGLLTLCGGTVSGWLAVQALSDPSVIVLQVLALALSWILLRRARARVLGHWAWTIESLIRG